MESTKMALKFVLLAITIFLLTEADLPDYCYLRKDPGPCRGKFSRFYFDKYSKKCKRFTFGGCQGNKNNFKTGKRCQNTCTKALCFLPPMSGRGKGAFIKFFYNKTSQKCQIFRYGGCGGNRNNFREILECHQTCATHMIVSEHICFLPADKGPCLGKKRRYFYNSTSNSCEVFIYTGCRGNDNNFKTKDDCYRFCPAPL